MAGGVGVADVDRALGPLQNHRRRQVPQAGGDRQLLGQQLEQALVGDRRAEQAARAAQLPGLAFELERRDRLELSLQAGRQLERQLFLADWAHVLWQPPRWWLAVYQRAVDLDRQRQEPAVLADQAEQRPRVG